MSPSRHRLRRLLAAVALAGCGIGSAAAQSSVDREVVELRFLGNESFPDEELEAAIVTEETRCRSFVFAPFCLLTGWGFAHERAYLDEGTLPSDLVRLRLFYRRRGFRQVRVDTLVDRRDGEVGVAFRIEEGRPARIRSLEIGGLEGVLEPDEIRESFPLREGDRFDLVALDRGKQALAERLRERGYVHAVVLEEHFIGAGDREVELTVEARRGPRARIGSISVRGAGEIGEHVVRQFLTFAEGQYVRQSRITQSQRDLYNLASIRFANIRTAVSSEVDTLVDVTVEVTPAEPRAVRTGLGMTTTECFQTQARLTHRNFFGGARNLRVQGSLANLLAGNLAGTFPCSDVGTAPEFQDLTFRVGAEFEQPYFLSGRNALRAGVFVERETVPDIFVRNSRGGELAVTRRLRARMPLTLSFRPEFTSFESRTADVFFCINFGFCTPSDIRQISEPRWLAPLTLVWRFDRTDAPLSPTRGYYVTLELEEAAAFTGSDYRYFRFGVDAADFEQLAPGLVLATHFRTGVVEPAGDRVFGGTAGEPVVHPRKRFFAGGAQSVRGFGQNLLGPTVLVADSVITCLDDPDLPCPDPLDPAILDERPVGGNAAFEVSVELRARVGEKWTLVGFLDAGQVWEDITTLKAPVATPGLGVRYASPVGPLRLDVGYDPTGSRRLPVVAQLPSGELLELEEPALFAPVVHDDPDPMTEFFRRLQFHVSIGEAF